MMKRLFSAIAALAAVVQAQVPYDSLYLRSTVYQQQTALHRLSRLSAVDIVMLGNSITAGGSWNELLGRTSVVNRGIVGDNTVGMLHRLQDVYRLSPKLCFIMAGINDLYADAPVETVFRNYRTILDSLRAHRIIPVIQSTLYVNPKWKRTEEKNPQVTQLNALLRRYASEAGIEFIDVNEALSAGSTLKPEFTTDGVHLNAAAYGVWRDLLMPVLQKHRL